MNEPGTRPLYKMFTTVPERYDLMNRLLTFGMDERWRRKAARLAMTSQPGKILDLCTGTGDLAIYFFKLCRKGQEVTALDFSEPMLEIAREKAGRKKISAIRFIQADVASLPFKDKSFDTVGIAFAFRNLTFHNPLQKQYLSEIKRILKPSGQCLIVETSQPSSRIIRRLFHLYLGIVVSALGGRLSGHRSAYHYLSFSARNFYDQDQVKELMLKSGFSRVVMNPLFMGMICIYSITN
jgi:demethylmenaquinone methyltransferase/2-methoxy-6-polyprenyl-1,4-benzoquinol methylase